MINYLIKHKSYLLVWLLLTSTAPFIFFSWPGHPYKILAFSCLSIMFIHFLYYKNKVIDKAIFGICLLQMAFYSFLILYHEDKSNINLIIQILSLIIVVTFINNFIGFKGYIKSYLYIITAMGIGGSIIFFLHILFGVNPLFNVDYSESGTSYFLYLTTTNVYYNLENGLRLIRYSGFFDEPGTYALYSMFALLINKIYFNNRKIEIILLITTIFTLSIAFYIFTIFYLLFFYVNKKNIKYLAIILSIAALVIVFLVNNDPNNPIIDSIRKLTIERFERNETSGFEGNNRYDLILNDKRIFFKYPFLGAGSVNEVIRGANPFSILAKYGIVGFFVTNGFIIYTIMLIFIQKRDNKSLHYKILFLILINLLQRPELSSVFSILVFISYIHYLKGKENISSITLKQQNK